MIRRGAAAILFLALLVGGLRLPILRLLLPPHRPPDVPGPLGGVDRKPLRLKNDPTPPEVLAFFEEVRQRTKPGESVGLLMAWPHEGWSYTYWRGSYALAGRHVPPPMAEGQPGETDVVAVWQKGWGHPAYDIVWQNENAAMLRRRR